MSYSTVVSNSRKNIAIFLGSLSWGRSRMPWDGDGVPSLALAIEDTSPTSPLLSGAWSKLGKSWGKCLGFFPQMGLGVFWQKIYIYIMLGG